MGFVVEPVQPIPDVRLLFIVNLVAVISVTVFATAVVALVLRRRYVRGLEQQKMAVIGTTTARILHQIKNPVQSLLLQAELLEEFERDGNAELRAEAGHAIAGEAMRLAAMLGELSAWTSGSERPLTREPVQLHQLLAGMARQEQRQARRRGIVFEARLACECTVRADPYYLRQAVENLLRNAREALEDRPDPRINLELEAVGARAVVRVRDNGPGIPRDSLARIWEPFVSTKGSGMGLGLPICKEIVERHGGELHVESEPGAGTTFSMTLPLHQPDRAMAAPNAGEPK